MDTWLRGLLKLSSFVLLTSIGAMAFGESHNDAPWSGLKILGRHHPFELRDLPQGRVRRKLEALSARNRELAMRWLHRFDFPRSDLESMMVDDEGAVFYIDPAPVDPLAHSEERRMADGAYAAASAVQAADDPFTLHSRPGSPNVVYLEFDGATLAGTAWSGGILHAKAFDLDDDPSSFSAAERRAIAEIWHRVAEDYAAFDIDVTTEEPASFGPTTGRVLITSKKQTTGASMPYSDAGGVAYVGVWGYSEYPSKYSPAFVYYDNLGSATTIIAEACSHELGHNLGLSHDGKGDSSYYGGHGSGRTSWAPIMGNSYSKNVTQWSDGDYAGASNTQDDVAILANALGFVPDDHGDRRSEATPLYVDANGEIPVSNPEIDPANTYPENKGVIGTSDDEDVFSFSTAGGPITLAVIPAWDAFYRDSERGANLDIEARLLDGNGEELARSDPGSETDATLSAVVPSGTYYLTVKGVGNGNYSEYASHGQYFISGSVGPRSSNAAPTASFSYSCAGATCRFLDASWDSDGSIVKYLWDFGDGSTSTQRSPDHTYGDPGAYTVTLRVTDDGGDTAASAREVVVSAAAGTSTIHFSEQALRAFNRQDVRGKVAVADGGATLSLVGNTWKRMVFPYEVTDQTVIEFDFFSGARGEIHGIGLEENAFLSADRIFKLYGTQEWGIRAFETYPGSGWTHYRIPVGQYYTGAMSYLVFVMDDDRKAQGESRFRNLRVYED